MSPSPRANTRRDSLEVPHFSSSLPSMQSGSASQCQRMGMQWPFLHWNWSLSHFKSQSCCRDASQSVAAGGQRRRSHRFYFFNVFIFYNSLSPFTSSDPSAQSWSPSHFHLPAMQRPLVQANSLSEHCRGTAAGTGAALALGHHCGGAVGRSGWRA